MTLKRKIGLAAVAVMILVSVAVVLCRGNKGQLDATFLRYENGNALIQITNRSRSAVAYSMARFFGVFIFNDDEAGTQHSANGLLQGHQGLQVSMPSANGGSNMVIAYFQVRGSLYRRVSGVLEKFGSGIPGTPIKPFCLTLDLPPPPQP